MVANSPGEGVGIKPLVHGSMANDDLLTGDKVRVLGVVAVVLPIRSLIDDLGVARIAGSPQFEPCRPKPLLEIIFCHQLYLAVIQGCRRDRPEGAR